MDLNKAATDEAESPLIGTRGLHHAGVVVSDLTRTIDFYTRFFDGSLEMRIDGIDDPRGAEMLGLAEIEMNIAMLAFGNARLELVEFRAPLGSSEVPRAHDVGTAHVAFEVDDVEQCYALLTAEGIEFDSPPVHAEEGPVAGWVVAYARDPDGNRVELLQTGSG